MNIRTTERTRAAAAAAAFALCAIALSWPVADPGPPVASDRDQYQRIAFNVARHGVFHDARDSAPERAAEEPYSRREPGYPLYLAAVFASSPEFAAVPSWECVEDPDCEAAAPLHERVWRLTSLLGAAAVAVAFLATFVLTRSWTVAAGIGGGWSLLLTPLVLTRDVPSFLAGLFLLVHATLAARTWRKPRIATGVLSGLALGLLVLTKAVFQYWLAGVALALAAGLWLDADRRRTLAPACAALVLAAWALTLPWMARNAVEVGHFGISGRGGEVLALRAEYNRMTWPEIRGAFAYYLPASLSTPSSVPFHGLRALAMRWLEPETFGYARFDHDNPRGFYRLGMDMAGDAAERADRIAPGWRSGGQATRDAVLKRAAADLIREDWLKHMALTLVFAERGAEFRLDGCNTLTDPADQRFGRLLGWPLGPACRIARYGTVLLLPFAGLLAVLAWRRRDASLALLLLPVAYAYGAHAAATHFHPRYSLPLVPVLVVATALAVHELAPRADRAAARLGSLALDAVRRRLPAGGGHSPVD